MKGAQTVEKIDFSKSLRDLYGGSSIVREVYVDEGSFVYVDGQGEPGGAEFNHCIEKLYGIAYGIKFALKNAGVDFTVSKLECLYYVPDAMDTPMSEWKWRLLMRVPDEVVESHLKEAKEALLKKKGQNASAVKLTEWEEGRCLQMMHIGPYDDLSETYNTLFQTAKEKGMRPSGPGHEIYLSDPNRAAPENLKTVVRMPVA